MKLFIFLVALLPVSCGAFRSGVRIEMSTISKAQTERAIELINIEARKQVISISPRNQYVLIYKVPNKQLEAKIAGAAYVGGSQCRIDIPERTFDAGEDFLTTVIWHEIGHCYGLNHVSDPNDIMYKSVGSIQYYSDQQKQNFLRRLYEAAN